ncbi:MAG: hypothetical protein AAF984_09715 [Verrucomicrobiota bacterium]
MNQINTIRDLMKLVMQSLRFAGIILLIFQVIVTEECLSYETRKPINEMSDEELTAEINRGQELINSALETSLQKKQAENRGRPEIVNGFLKEIDSIQGFLHGVSGVRYSLLGYESRSIEAYRDAKREFREAKENVVNVENFMTTMTNNRVLGGIPNFVDWSFGTIGSLIPHMFITIICCSWIPLYRKFIDS